MEGVSSGVVYLQCLFPHMGAAKHSCCFREHLTGELLRIYLLKLSEKPRECLWRSLTDRREGSFRPISPSSYRPDPTLGAVFAPFSDSLSRRSGEEEEKGRTSRSVFGSGAEGR
jgi:hypothetical protein